MVEQQASRTTTYRQKGAAAYVSGGAAAEGGVLYLDGEPLNRPLTLPAAVKRGIVVAMAVAAVIGAAVLYLYFDRVLGAPAHEREAIEATLSENRALDLPDLLSFMALDDESIVASLREGGASFYEKIPVGTLPEGGFEMIKVPAGMDLEEATALHRGGIDKLKATDAVNLLYGSWDYDVSRDGSTEMRVRYVEFDAENVEIAIANALAITGLSGVEIADSGVDAMGNTYATGSVERDGATYTWRASSLPLSEVYGVRGLPESAFYVGVRFSS